MIVTVLYIGMASGTPLKFAISNPVHTFGFLKKHGGFFNVAGTYLLEDRPYEVFESQLMTEQGEVKPFQLQARVWQQLLVRDKSWYQTREARYIAENVLCYQRASGGWPKNIDYTKKISRVEKRQLSEYPEEPAATIDNGATFSELYFLARMYQVTFDQRYALAFLRGVDYLLAAQYENGGWPQFYPLRPGYYSHITFNDDAMIGVLRLFRDIDQQNAEFAFVDLDRRQKIKVALNKGIACILATQVRVDGRLTAWCAQYDETSLEPARARVYEHPSLSSEETVGIVRFLMEMEPPTPAIIAAVQAAVKWLQAVKIEGLSIVEKPEPNSPTGFDKIVVKNANAPPIWARFYEIGTNRPFFSDRDGKKYYDLNEISIERRNRYGWLGYWPRDLLDSLYPQWQRKWIQRMDDKNQID